MSVKAMSWAWDIQGLSSGQKLVLLAIADHADDQGYCYPSQERLARKCCMNRSTINQHIQALVESGWLDKVHRADKAGHRASNGYHLNIGKTNVGNSKVGNSKVGNSKVGKTPPPELEIPTQTVSEPSDGGGGGRARAREAQAQQEQQRKQTGTDPTEPTTAFAALREEISRHGWNLHRVLAGDTAQHIRQWAAMGVTADDIRDAITEATTDRKGQRKPLPNTPQYLTPILARIVEARAAMKNPAGDATSAPGQAPSKPRERDSTRGNHNRPLGRGERTERQFKRQLESLERALAEEAQEELDRGAVDQAPCDLRSEVVRLLPRRHNGSGQD